MFESRDNPTGGKNNEDGQEEFVFPFNEEILPSLDVSTSVDMPRNFDDVGNLKFLNSMKFQKVMEIQMTRGC